MNQAALCFTQQQLRSLHFYVYNCMNTHIYFLPASGKPAVNRASKDLQQARSLVAVFPCTQDISMMLHDMNATQGSAEVEKAAIDDELHRIQNLVRSFQDRINAVGFLCVFYTPD